MKNTIGKKKGTWRKQVERSHEVRDGQSRKQLNALRNYRPVIGPA